MKKANFIKLEVWFGVVRCEAVSLYQEEYYVVAHSATEAERLILQLSKDETEPGDLPYVASVEFECYVYQPLARDQEKQ